MKLPGATALVVMLVAALATTGTCTELSEIFEVSANYVYEQHFAPPDGAHNLIKTSCDLEC